ncbi:MAG: PH domain-containing protein [bacterium]|nr:PH domain-containing protein [bacterium]
MTESEPQFYFPDQKPDEKVFLFVRRHWISFAPTILISIFMIFFPIAVIIGIIYGFKIEVNPIIVQYIILSVSAYILFIMTFFIVGWVDYYFDVLIITDERLVNIEQNGLFNRHISELDLLRVQNVSTSVKGILPTMFDYGCVVVQTAGENPMSGANSRTSDFTMESMPGPQHIAQTILHLHQELVSKRGQTKAALYGEGEIHPHSHGDDDNTENPNENDKNDKKPKPVGEDSPKEKDNTPKNTEEPQESIYAHKLKTSEGSELETVSPKDQEDTEPPQPAATLRHVKDEGQLREGETIDL